VIDEWLVMALPHDRLYLLPFEPYRVCKLICLFPFAGYFQTLACFLGRTLWAGLVDYSCR